MSMIYAEKLEGVLLHRLRLEQKMTNDEKVSGLFLILELHNSICWLTTLFASF